MNYVVGFVFTPDLQNVLVIKKNRPDWMTGYYNGVGGKIEPGERHRDAMVRECEEETGLKIPYDQWTHMAILKGGYSHIGLRQASSWVIHFFFCTFDGISAAKAMTDEQILIIRTNCLQSYNVLPQVRWLIPLAANFNNNPNKVRYSEPILIYQEGVSDADQAVRRQSSLQR